MTPSPVWLRGPRLAWGALVAAGALVFLTGWEAVRLTALPVVVAPADSKEFDGFRQPQGRSLREALAAVDGDPFHPERRRPARRFRLPGDATALASASQLDQPVRLIGTVVAADGASFALCQWAGEAPRRVRVGERVSDLTLVRVEPGRVVFQREAGGELVIERPRAGS